MKGPGRGGKASRVRWGKRDSISDKKGKKNVKEQGRLTLLDRKSNREPGRIKINTVRGKRQVNFLKEKPQEGKQKKSW